MTYVRPRTRNGTWDKLIFEQVMRGEYGPIDFKDKVVVDVGAHIGAFSTLAARSGAKLVHAYEPNEENYKLLVHNTTVYGVEAYEGAVWRSDGEALCVYWNGSEESENTGGGFVEEADLESRRPGRIPAYRFDGVIERAGGHIDVLKLDCEGSEYPILYTSKMLDKVSLIVGEFHPGVRGHIDDTPEKLEPWLQEQGYQTAFRPTASGLGLFTAIRA
jgi:FkbM family methyltransferase